MNFGTYLNEAVLVSKEAECARAKVGCIITDIYGDILGKGANLGYCPGVDCVAYANSVSCNKTHAEIAAINAIPEGRLSEVHYAFVTHRPCDKCNAALINIDAKVIVYIGNIGED